MDPPGPSKTQKTVGTQCYIQQSRVQNHNRSHHARVFRVRIDLNSGDSRAATQYSRRSCWCHTSRCLRIWGIKQIAVRTNMLEQPHEDVSTTPDLAVNEPLHMSGNAKANCPLTIGSSGDSFKRQKFVHENEGAAAGGAPGRMRRGARGWRMQRRGRCRRSG